MEDGRTPVRVGELFQGEGPALEAGLREALTSGLAASPRFTWSDRPGALRAEASLLQEGVEERWVLRVELEVPPELRRGFAVTTITGAASAGAGPDAPGPAALREAAGRALRRIEAQCQLAAGDLAGLEALLTAEEPEQVLVGLRFIRDRHEVALADRVVPLLRHADARVRIAALDVLAGVGAPDHAAAVIRSLELHERQGTREAYRALGQLGGAEAVGFLQFAAANEDDPALRVEAERALSSAFEAEETRARTGEGRVDLPKLARGHRQ